MSRAEDFAVSTQDHDNVSKSNDLNDTTTATTATKNTTTTTSFDLEKQPTTTAAAADTENSDPLEPIPSHVTNQDMPPVPPTSYAINEEIYTRFSPARKRAIVAVLSYCSFLAPVSSTTILSAVPEVAAAYDTTGTIINLSNAMYMLFMGLSPMFWGPMGQVYGRRWTSISSGVLFFAFSIGTALAPNLASYYIFRILTAFQGTAFLIIGSACIGDIYKPTERATALSWFMSGTLVGPAFGPFIGGIIVTFRSWRDIFWLQVALAGLAFVLMIFLLPETTHYKKSVELEGLTPKQRVSKMWSWMNPMRVLKLYRYPNLITVGIASSSLVWNMYSLLTPIRYVLNPRFNLTTPIQSGLFYIAPGCGYLFGTFFGGRWADHTVKKWIKLRGGERVPEDRIRSALPALGVVIPACILIYGWSIEEAKGGIPLPVIVMFVQGVAQLFCFPSLNTYCLDVMQSQSAEVVAGNYCVRYIFAALGSALCLPAIEKIGVGGFSSISTGFLVVAAGLTHITTIYGRGWREGVDRRKAEKEERRRAKSGAGDVEAEGETGAESDGSGEK